MEGIAKERVVGSQQTEVYAPGIKADADQLLTVGIGSKPQPVLDLAPKAQSVPVQAVEHLDRTIRKAMQFLQAKPSAVEMTDYGSAAFRAEVTGQELGCLGHGLPSHYPISCPPVTLMAWPVM